jgi:transposase
MSPLLLSGIYLLGMEWGPTCVLIMLDFEHARMEHHERDDEQVPPEMRVREVRLVLDNDGRHGSRWQAVMSISAKIGCAPQTLNEWVKKAKVNSGKRAGIPADMAGKMKALERANRESRQANEILCKANVYLSMAELDRRSK